jgi:hypothetical protein
MMKNSIDTFDEEEYCYHPHYWDWSFLEWLGLKFDDLEY